MKSIQKLETNYIETILKKQRECEEKIKNLEKEERKDEANLIKIRWNVYGIFASIFKTHMNHVQKKINSSEDEQYKKFCQMYKSQFDNIPTAWKLRLQKAKEFDKIEDILVEEIKLAVVEELKELFLSFE